MCLLLDKYRILFFCGTFVAFCVQVIVICTLSNVGHVTDVIGPYDNTSCTKSVLISCQRPVREWPFNTGGVGGIRKIGGGYINTIEFEYI